LIFENLEIFPNQKKDLPPLKIHEKNSLLEELVKSEIFSISEPNTPNLLD